MLPVTYMWKPLTGDVAIYPPVNASMTPNSKRRNLMMAVADVNLLCHIDFTVAKCSKLEWWRTWRLWFIVKLFLCFPVKKERAITTNSIQKCNWYTINSEFHRHCIPNIAKQNTHIFIFSSFNCTFTVTDLQRPSCTCIIEYLGSAGLPNPLTPIKLLLK